MSPERVAAMTEMYKTRSLQDVGVAFGVCGATVRYHLLRHDVPLRKQGYRVDQRRGQAHHGWGGGRHKTAAGYFVIRAIDHPHAHRGYIFEHRRIVERHLQETQPHHPALAPDGFMRRDWIVHHVNGVKDDNRLENLEAMPKSRHTSALHYTVEIDRLRALLDSHGIDWKSVT